MSNDAVNFLNSAIGAKTAKEERSDDLFRQIMATKDRQEALVLLRQHIVRNEEECMEFVSQMYQQLTEGFIHEDLRNLRRAGHSMKNRKTMLKNMRRKELVGMRLKDKTVAIEKIPGFTWPPTAASRFSTA